MKAVKDDSHAAPPNTVESIREMAYRFNNEPDTDHVDPNELEHVINAAERYFGLPESRPETGSTKG
jgi:hypothetical protein